MPSYKTMLKANLQTRNGSLITAATHTPDNLIGVKTTRVYSQIARMGRDPRKKAEHTFLINILEDASVQTSTNGKIKKIDPPFVVIKVREATKYFEQRTKDLQGSSFFCLINDQ